MKNIYKTIATGIISAGLILNISYSTGEPIDGILVNGNPIVNSEIVEIESCENEVYDIEIVPKFSSYQEPEKVTLEKIIYDLQVLTGQRTE